jgi:hypothetical protein
MLTDGWVSDERLAKNEIQQLKKMGIYLLVVGMGEHLEDAGLKDLVNSTEVVHVETWKGLKDKFPEMKKKLQKEIQRIDRELSNTNTR